MLRRLVSWVRARVSVEDPEDRIEGSGEPIVAPQHRRAADAERMLDDEDGDDRPDGTGNSR